LQGGAADFVAQRTAEATAVMDFGFRHGELR
jgi:hypothetical protein